MKWINNTYQAILRPVSKNVYRLNESLIQECVISKNQVNEVLFDLFKMLLVADEFMFASYDEDKYFGFPSERNYKIKRVQSFLNTHL